MQVPAQSPTTERMTLLERLRSDVNHASAARTGAPSPSSLTSFGVMRQRIHRAAEVLGLPDDMAEQIAQPRRVIELNLLIEMEMEVAACFRRGEFSTTQLLSLIHI